MYGAIRLTALSRALTAGQIPPIARPILRLSPTSAQKSLPAVFLMCGCLYPSHHYYGGVYRSHRKTAAPTSTSSATPEPAIGSSPSGGGTPASSGNGSASGGTPAATSTVPSGVTGNQQPSTRTASAFGQAEPTTGSGNTFGQPSPTFDPGKLARIGELLTKSLLGEDLVNTQFHLFSARSSSSGRVMKPRVLCANNALLAKSSKYFSDLLSSDIYLSDPSLVDLTGDNDIPSDARVGEYGYESDSDFDDRDDLIPAANPEASKDHSAASSTSTSQVNTETQPKDGIKLSEDVPGSDMLTTNPKQVRTDGSFTENKDGATPVVSSETAVLGTVENNGLENQTAMHLQSLGSRHILVKDTAFQTWYTLLSYLYTGKFGFLPLSSAMPGGHPGSLSSSANGPRCSAKSMYRLASKVGLDSLRDEAFDHIRSNLTEHNILKELSCSLVSKHPQLLEMELDVLYTHIKSPPVVANFATLVQRIANKELPHGADIMIGIHTRLLQEHQRHPSSLGPGAGGPGSGPPISRPRSSGPSKPVEPTIGASDAPSLGAVGSSYADKRSTRSESSLSESTPHSTAELEKYRLRSHARPQCLPQQDELETATASKRSRQEDSFTESSSESECEHVVKKQRTRTLVAQVRMNLRPGY
ncbi:hypothetical protein HD554DRAFT_2298928 [Boletus coccyginus]|nr:hypothetical protein HD554DRAFT_2298928 [Boletus coccyginus]